MKAQFKYILVLLLVFCTVTVTPIDLSAQGKTDLDRKVEKFLENHKYRWHDMNIPTKEGQIIYDLIIQNNYKQAVEIGTSTGHSAIWIAWALSKTGGKLITIEINETRYRKALENFRETGLEAYIDCRLGDAHKMVPDLDPPIDFVFCDADKDWYKNYFKNIRKKLSINGCFVAHNIKGNTYRNETKKFIEYLQKQSDFKTRLNESGDTGMSISYKIK